MTRVALLRSGVTSYAAKPPFHPPAIYPELAGPGSCAVQQENSVFKAVRETFALLGLDAAHYGTPHWNPLGKYVRPGDTVVIKPNLVLHEYGMQRGASCLTTHGSIIRAVVDYVHRAAGPSGRIVIADAPLQGADFDSILNQSGIREIQEYYHTRFHREIEVVDLRQVRAVIDEASSLIKRVEKLAGDPAGYEVIDLGSESCLRAIDRHNPWYVVGDYDATVTNARHNHGRHEYVVSRTILEADAIISVPKLKTHSKAGITVCLKNLVGIIGSKDCLPHHRHGKTGRGGDEFPANYPRSWLWSNRLYGQLQGRLPQPVWRGLRALAKTFLGAGTPINGDASGSRFFASGGWHGNDTIWRAVSDLNRIAIFYDLKNKRLAEQPQRRYFALVDGIIAMEGNGPLRGTPRACGLLLAGEDPLAVDVAAATVMGFDWQRIRMLQGIAHSGLHSECPKFSGDESEIELRSSPEVWQSMHSAKENHLGFRPAAGWRGSMELKKCEPSGSTIAPQYFSKVLQSL